jgi:hypothetical protein
MLRLCDFEPSDRERLDWTFKLDEPLGENAIQFKKPDGIVVMSKCALDEFLFDAADEIVSALELDEKYIEWMIAVSYEVERHPQN